ncbi:MAG: hypothetical protein AAF585_11170, partial [Verrucomicrobiota bacterium]
ISANITPGAPDGVIIAQGGSLVGYSLYLRKGKVIFGVRVENKVQELDGGDFEIEEPLKIEAKLGKDGSRTLSVNGESVSAEGPPLNPQPKMGLSVGEDQGPNVGAYSQEAFKGSIQHLVLDIK